MLTVYSKLNCQFCDQAKHLLKSKDIAFEEVRVDQDSTARQFLMEQGHRSVPQIYLGKELFVENGYQGLTKLSDDELRTKLGDSIVSN